MSDATMEVLRALADRIHTLLFPPSPREHLERMREQFRAALEQHDRYLTAASAWWRRWEAHVKRLDREPRLKNREAGPPERGWVWAEHLDDTTRSAPDAGKTPNVRLRLLQVLLKESTESGWFPPELADASNLPPSPWPRLAMGGDPPEMVLMRQYVVVALTHDTTDEALGRVRPRVLEGIGLPEPAYHVRWLMKDFEPDSIEEAIASVRQDLTSRAATPRSETRCAVEVPPPRALPSGPDLPSPRLWQAGTGAGIMATKRKARKAPLLFEAVQEVRVRHSCGHWEAWFIPVAKRAASIYIEAIRETPCPSCYDPATAVKQSRETVAGIRADLNEFGLRMASLKATNEALNRVGHTDGLWRVFASTPQGRALKNDLLALLKTFADDAVKLRAVMQAEKKASVLFSSEAFAVWCIETTDHLKRLSAKARTTSRTLNAEWKRLTGVVPPSAQSIEDVKRIIIPWWKEQAAAVGIDPNKILESGDKVIVDFEPIITGRLRRLSLQAAVREAEAAEGNWSRPMALTDLADRIFKNPRMTRKVQRVYGKHLRHVAKKTWQIRLDPFADSPSVLQALEKA